MARAQIIVIVDQPADVAAFDAWLAANELRLTFLSDNTGCGCCVDIYDVEGPEDVLRTIPQEIRAWSPTAAHGTSSQGKDETKEPDHS